MTGSLQHLGGQRYRTRVYVDINPTTGRQRMRSRSFTAPNGRAAQKIHTSICAAIDAERRGRLERKGTVSELVDEWMTDRRRNVSPTTLPNYERIAKVIDARFGRMQRADLNARTLDRWYGELLDAGMSPASIGKYHSVMRAMLRRGARWEMVDKVATFNATPPKTHRYKAQPPTVLAAEAVICKATGDLVTALRFIQLTGLRRGELCGLAWPDVAGDRLTVQRTAYDKRGGGVAIKDVPKGGESRVIALSTLELAVLADQWSHLEQLTAKLGTAANPLGPIWADLRADPEGRVPRRPGWLSLRWRQLCKKEGATGIRLHDLRHMNATTLLDAGVPITTVSKRLGHSRTSTTTDIYGHGTDVGEAQAVAAIERAFGAG